MDHLLNDILRNPTGPSMDQIEQNLNNTDGQNEFMDLLKNGNVMAFTYMKMRCKEWIENPERIRMIHSSKDILLSLIFTSSESNFGILCFFFETLYLYDSAWDELVRDLCDNPNERSVRVLNHMFNKYRIRSKSDVLYSEIIKNIDLSKEIFIKAYFESQSENEDILGMFYSLIYQDIHPFFEDNTDRFIGSFCVLFRKQGLQKEICEIFNLFIMKYSDCVDMTRILGALLANITGFEYLKYSVLLNIVKRKNYPALMKFSSALSNVVKIGAYVSPDEIDEMSGDILSYSRNLLKGHDVNRGIVVEITGHLRTILGEEWTNTLVGMDTMSTMDEERLIFICLALKLRLKNVIDRCLTIIKDGGCIGYLGVVSFRYLLCMNEYSTIDPRYIDRKNPSSFLAMTYLVKYLDTCGLTSLESYSLGTKGWEIVGGMNYYVDVMNKLVTFLRGHIEDEFSSQLIHRIIRIDISIVDQEMIRFINEFTESKIRNINSPLAYFYLLDVLGIIFLSSGDDSLIVRLIQVVLSEEIVEIYSSSFYLLATVIVHSEGDFSSVMEMIGQESLWKANELLLSMVCLTISLFRRGYCSEEQVEYIVDYLVEINVHCGFVLLNGTVTSRDYSRWIKEGDVEESFILVSTLHEKELINMDEYRNVYFKSLGYFEQNFISRRNARRVLGKLKCGVGRVGGDDSVHRIIERNIHNIGYENAPFSAIITFDL